MDRATINLGVGLIILISVNIILGSLSAMFIKKFEIWRFIRGCIKGVIVIGCFVATYFVGYLNPDIVAVNVGGVEGNVMAAIKIIMLPSYYHYAKQAIEKLGAMINGDLLGNDTAMKTASETAKAVPEVPIEPPSDDSPSSAASEQI